VKMLRSEVEWFQRFIDICQSQLDWCMSEGDVEYQAMKQVLQCTGKREVQAFLNAYNDDNFTDHIKYKLLLAQRLVAREKKDPSYLR